MDPAVAKLQTAQEERAHPRGREAHGTTHGVRRQDSSIHQEVGVTPAPRSIVGPREQRDRPGPGRITGQLLSPRQQVSRARRRGPQLGSAEVPSVGQLGVASRHPLVGKQQVGKPAVLVGTSRGPDRRCADKAGHPVAESEHRVSPEKRPQRQDELVRLGEAPTEPGGDELGVQAVVVEELLGGVKRLTALVGGNHCPVAEGVVRIGGDAQPRLQLVVHRPGGCLCSEYLSVHRRAPFRRRPAAARLPVDTAAARTTDRFACCDNRCGTSRPIAAPSASRATAHGGDNSRARQAPSHTPSSHSPPLSRLRSHSSRQAAPGIAACVASGKVEVGRRNIPGRGAPARQIVVQPTGDTQQLLGPLSHLLPQPRRAWRAVRPRPRARAGPGRGCSPVETAA